MDGVTKWNIVFLNHVSLFSLTFDFSKTLQVSTLFLYFLFFYGESRDVYLWYLFPFQDCSTFFKLLFFFFFLLDIDLGNLTSSRDSSFTEYNGKVHASVRASLSLIFIISSMKVLLITPNISGIPCFLFFLTVFRATPYDTPGYWQLFVCRLLPSLRPCFRFYYGLPQSSIVAWNITPCDDPIGDKYKMYKIAMIQISNMFLIIISTILLT